MPARTLPNLGLQAFFLYGESGWNDEYDLNMLTLSVLVQGRVESIVADFPGAPDLGDIHILDEDHPTLPNRVIVRDLVGPEGEEEEEWVMIAPKEGWLLYNLATDGYIKFDGTAWVEFVGGGGVSLPAWDEENIGSALTVVAGEEEEDPPVLGWVPPGGGGGVPVVNNTSDPSFTIQGINMGMYTRMTDNTDPAPTVIVTTHATEAKAVGDEWHIRNMTPNNVTVTPAGGVTVNAPFGGTLLIPPNGTVTLKNVAEDEFDLFGLVVPA